MEPNETKPIEREQGFLRSSTVDTMHCVRVFLSLKRDLGSEDGRMESKRDGTVVKQELGMRNVLWNLISPIKRVSLPL